MSCQNFQQFRNAVFIHTCRTVKRLMIFSLRTSEDCIFSHISENIMLVCSSSLRMKRWFSRSLKRKEVILKIIAILIYKYILDLLQFIEAIGERKITSVFVYFNSMYFSLNTHFYLLYHSFLLTPLLFTSTSTDFFLFTSTSFSLFFFLFIPPLFFVISSFFSPFNFHSSFTLLHSFFC